MLRLIDSMFDRIAERLAHNICENLEAVEQNRAAREAGESQFQRPKVLSSPRLSPNSQQRTWVYERAIFTA